MHCQAPYGAVPTVAPLSVLLTAIEPDASLSVASSGYQPTRILTFSPSQPSMSFANPGFWTRDSHSSEIASSRKMQSGTVYSAPWPPSPPTGPPLLVVPPSLAPPAPATTADRSSSIGRSSSPHPTSQDAS